MLNILPRLLLVFSIVFAPVGQSIAIDMVDMAKGCTECSSHMDENSSCVNNGCFQDGCINSFSVSPFSFLTPFSALDIDDLSFRFRDRYDPHFTSQVPLPLYRPPIA